MAIALSVLTLCTTGIARAWSNGGYSDDIANPDYGTHDWVAEKSLILQSLDVSFLSDTFKSQYLLGTEAPDNPAYIGDSTNHHVYYYLDGTLQDDICADRAQAMYDEALDRMLDSDMENAAFYVGAMAHYIADVGAYGHTMGASTDWGAETHHTTYENWFESRLETFDTPSDVSLMELNAGDAARSLGFKITFGDGAVRSNVWMDEQYDWLDAEFVASARASLNASVEAVAAAINDLLLEYYLVIPEFHSGTLVAVLIVTSIIGVLAARFRTGDK
ncbi:MAG: zinc dependent phospholipase C family protein [Methanobacteriota archaeon]|nr:MAG: zinc dependent phospholipase C family protein [Euryarchaeota archaeon]